MHTLEDLRAIRDLEFVVGDRRTQEENYRGCQNNLRCQQQAQTPVVVVTYDLATRQIYVRKC